MSAKAERQQRLMADRERRHQERAPRGMGIDAADRYASAVLDVLAEDFPDLRDPVVADIVHQHVYLGARGYATPEVIVDNPFTANWRLIPAPHDRTRVHLACWRQNRTDADSERWARLNAALDALVPGTDDKEG